MTPAEMENLVEDHLRAEGNGDPAGAVANYTQDVEHDVVGFPGGPVRGIPAALDFYRQLVTDFRTEGEKRLHTYYADDACVIENLMQGTVTGAMLGIPGNNRHIEFRVLHVFEFQDGKIARENVWLDGASIAAQLTA
ncbi:ester cyclase [Nocardia sp. NPDC051832]|uniref:ester cyclase n=1 Tax=Nocardia sp. NPDC051832 TaxID=3155673 RepID=UPI0034474E81